MGDPVVLSTDGPHAGRSSLPARALAGRLPVRADRGEQRPLGCVDPCLARLGGRVGEPQDGPVTVHAAVPRDTRATYALAAGVTRTVGLDFTVPGLITAGSQPLLESV